MIEIDYNNFESDCHEVFGKYLLKFNFKEIHFEELELEKTYENEFWKIKISMISDFPHIGVSFEFMSKDDHHMTNSLLEKLIKVDRKKTREIYDKLFNKDYYKKSGNEQYKIEMSFCVELLELSYIPLMNGSFTYNDYKKHI
ncbi:hypothetical protein [Flavobacterium branchiicola]|uniref:Uncharacterized protein n=1 Tax=Flavobacterium branchiicola TaxID=1114875 RepID=A0ABV9PBV9_9FLAO|nr:hypothetical protein [Flavobacterium branchiicola]MBS7253175.1 hypothetical protein [Flavobacterium branchiicola]